MRYGIGLDVGITSVGYSVLEIGDNDMPVRIDRLGARIFDVAENPKNGDSLAKPRREKRSMRRRLRRKRHRLERIKGLIVSQNILAKEDLASLYNGNLSDIYELRTKANVWIKDHPLGVENSSIDVSFEPLWNQSDYAAIHERLSLCDTVTVTHSILGITAKMKVVKTIYDSLREKYKSITLGTLKASLTSKINDLENEVSDTQKEVNRLPSLFSSAIANATKLITGNSGGNVVLHANANGEPYELLIMDSEEISSAVNVWRWNLGGLGFSSHGYNGPYETAITGDGSIVADFITAGSLVANIIKAGILSSYDGSSYWNIETGEVVLRAYATTESVEEQTSRIDNIEDQKMYRLVISSSNGNIFKNGSISTVLSATVFSWDEDITDTLDPNQFIWTRVSSDSEEDKLWNQAHYGGTKSISITNDDVKVRATFYCDLIDTTTRQSLLGD